MLRQQYCSLNATFSHLRLVVPYHLFQSHTDSPLGLPLEALFGSGGVGTTHLGVVSRDGFVNDVDTASALDTILVLNLLNNIADEFGKFSNGELVSVTNVNWTRLIRVHERDETVDEVMDVLEGASLFSVTVDSHIFTLERLDDKVRDDASIIGVH